ncbi:MAG: hypothetical protein CM1200mP10_13180 [Candidatus Neomarinimicrobiota bacterium]|nr:MAG: hypothetical protein CM1200mP10_13180 [Candidatus Neomarinimicrobiota bacterium]
MAKKYSKAKLAQFRISIEKRMEEIAEDMGDIHDGILDNGNNSEGLSQEIPSSVFIWLMLEQTLLNGKKNFIFNGS